jgi:hypothetical protein
MIGRFPVLNMMDDFDKDMPLNIVLWGKNGCGKTILASTALTPILFITFDPNGYQTIKDRPGNFVYNLVDASPDICADMQKFDDNVGVFNYLKQRGIRTVVFDSLTSYWDLALHYAVGKDARTNNQISMETPSQAGYGRRVRAVHAAMTSLMGLTMRMKIDTIIILHEKAQQTKQVVVQGAGGKPTVVEQLQDITPSVTENIMNSIGVRVGEIWHMTALDGGKRRIEVRPCHNYSPMKTRMFEARGTNCEFNVPFDLYTGEGDGIATWVTAWREGGGRRIALPK